MNLVSPFGQFILNLRAKRNWSLNEMAGLIGCDPSTICKWESPGGTYPTLTMLHIIADALEMEAGDLFKLMVPTHPKRIFPKTSCSRCPTIVDRGKSLCPKCKGMIER